MRGDNASGLARVAAAFGLGVDALLGQGGESWVLLLDAERIARVNRPGTQQAQVNGRIALLAELANSAGRVPFAIPQVLEATIVEEHFVTVEKRLPGRPMSEVLGEVEGEARASLVCAYLEAASQIGNLAVERPWFGDLLHPMPIRTNSFRDYLEQKAAQSLRSAGQGFAGVDPGRLAAALPEPEERTLVHLDAFPGNMLVDEGRVSAVLDFGASCIVGDRRLDPLAAAAYLAEEITPEATAADRVMAEEWLADRGLDGLYAAAREWLAAYWSFAWDDVNVHLWCRAILVE